MAKAHDIKLPVDVQVNLDDADGTLDRWIAVQMAGELVAMLAMLPPESQRQRLKINEALDTLYGAVNEPDWKAPWREPWPTA